jgi:hypothetical protein
MLLRQSGSKQTIYILRRKRTKVEDEVFDMNIDVIRFWHRDLTLTAMGYEWVSSTLFDIDISRWEDLGERKRNESGKGS